MKNVLKAFGIIALVAVIGFSMAACEEDVDSDNTDGGSWNAGKSLKGTSWEARDTYGTPGSSLYSYDKTYTITFTSDNMLTITEVGWSEIRQQHVSGYNITYTTNRTPVNKSYNGSYEYYSNIKEGSITSSFFEYGLWNFRILSDDRTMMGKLDAGTYTRK